MIYFEKKIEHGYERAQFNTWFSNICRALLVDLYNLKTYFLLSIDRNFGNRLKQYTDSTTLLEIFC